MGTPWALPGDASGPLLGRFWDVPGPLGKALEKSSLIAAGYNGSPVVEARKKRKVPNLSKKHEQKTEAKNVKKMKKCGQHVKMQRKTDCYSAQEKRNKLEKVPKKVENEM